MTDQNRADRLIALARQNFDTELRFAEVQALRDSASSLELPLPEEPGELPEVRAGFLRWLATDPDARPLLASTGIRVQFATITSVLDCKECRDLPSIRLSGCLVLERINLQSAKTSGIYFTACSLAEGMHADGLVVDGPLFLRDLTDTGSISLRVARIQGQLSCSGTELTAKGVAFSLDRANIGDGVFLIPSLTSAFRCAGTFSLVGAQIEGQLKCNGAQFTAVGNALVADGAVIGGEVFLSQGFVCSGTIRLVGAKIGGDLYFVGAQLMEVRCDNMKLSGNLIWQGIRNKATANLDLSGAGIRNLLDDKESWPLVGQLAVDGLVYERRALYAAPTQKLIDEGFLGQELTLPVEGKIAWLMLQSPQERLKPQPWVQVAAQLDASGDRAGAKHVRYEFRRLQAQGSWPLWRWVRIVFAWLEEAPSRILISIAATLFLGTLVFAGASCAGSMVPTAKDYYERANPIAQEAMRHYPPFNPFVYALENTVPLVKLGMDDKWTPDPAPSGSPRCMRWCWFCDGLAQVSVFRCYWFLAIFRWALIFSGWFQAAVLGAALTSRFKS